MHVVCVGLATVDLVHRVERLPGVDDKAEALAADVAPRVAAGEIRCHETVFEGLRSAPDAFLAMMRGDGLGKNLVRIA